MRSATLTTELQRILKRPCIGSNQLLGSTIDALEYKRRLHTSSSAQCASNCGTRESYGKLLRKIGRCTETVAKDNCFKEKTDREIIIRGQNARTQSTVCLSPLAAFINHVRRGQVIVELLN